MHQQFGNKMQVLLHWLPVQQSNHFHVLMCHKSPLNQSPGYLSKPLQGKQTENLCRSSQIHKQIQNKKNYPQKNYPNKMAEKNFQNCRSGFICN